MSYAEELKAARSKALNARLSPKLPIVERASRFTYEQFISIVRTHNLVSDSLISYISQHYGDIQIDERENFGSVFLRLAMRDEVEKALNLLENQ